MFFSRQVFCHRLWKEMYDICGTMLSNGWQYFKFAFFLLISIPIFVSISFFCLDLLLFTLPFFRWCLLLSSAEPSLAACLIPSPRFSICWPTNKAQFNWKLLSCHPQQSSELRIKWWMWYVNCDSWWVFISGSAIWTTWNKAQVSRSFGAKPPCQDLMKNANCKHNINI